MDELGLEIWSIALPAALALAADPITSLVDTAFVGHLGIFHFSSSLKEVDFIKRRRLAHEVML